jgi:acetyl esterase/lipase
MPLDPDAAAILSAMAEVETHPLDTMEPLEARTRAGSECPCGHRGLHPVSDEGEAYARRLREAGVPIIVSLYEGQMHGPFIMGAVIPTGAVVLQEAIGHTQRALGSPNMPSGAGAGLVVA